MDKRSLPERIINLREIDNMSQTDLAKKMNIDKSAMSKIENGTRKVSSEELNQIATIFNVSSDYLLGRNTNKAKADEIHNMSIDEALGTIMSFDGKPVTDHDKKVMKDLLESYLRNKE